VTSEDGQVRGEIKEFFPVQMKQIMVSCFEKFY